MTAHILQLLDISSSKMLQWQLYYFVFKNWLSYSVTTPTKATQQNFPQIKWIKIVEVNNSI